MSDKVWSEVWKNTNPQKMQDAITQEKKSVRWRIMKQFLMKRGLQNKTCIELGSGVGMYSFLLAQAGCHVTLLDSCEEALALAEQIFSQAGLSYTILKKDLLDENLEEKYDICLSIGVAEHFAGADRLRVIEAHHHILNESGVAILSVPNEACYPYTRWKKKLEESNRWEFGLEIPYSNKELKKLCRIAGFSTMKIYGSPLIDALDRFCLHKLVTRTIGHADLRIPYIDDYFGSCLIGFASKTKKQN